MEKLIPVNHWENTLLGLDGQRFAIRDAFAQCYNAGPAKLRPGLNPHWERGRSQFLSPVSTAKHQEWCSGPESPSAHDGSSEIKSFPHFYSSSPNSAQPPRKLIKQFTESSWNIMSSGRVWLYIPGGLCRAGVLDMAPKPTWGSFHLLFWVVQSSSQPWAGTFTHCFSSRWCRAGCLEENNSKKKAEGYKRAGWSPRELGHCR